MEKILSIGMPNMEFENTSFLSTTNLDEYNVILWDVPSVHSELNAFKQNWDYLVGVVPERLRRLKQWVIAGHTLILLNHQPIYAPFLAALGVNTLQDFEPLNGVEFVVADGRKIETCGPKPASEILELHVKNLSYSALISGKGLVPLLQVVRGSPGTRQIVGGYQQFGEGRIVHLPQFLGNPTDRLSFLKAISALPTSLAQPPAQLPDWVNSYRTHFESKAHDAIISFEREISAIKSRISEQQEIISSSQNMKQLIAGSGVAFEQSVALALRELGLMVVEGPHSRADLLASNGSRYAAIEVKGVDGPAREDYLRQVTVWMAEVDTVLSIPRDEHDTDHKQYFGLLGQLDISSEGLHEDCKGLLVVGTYRSIPLSQRIEPDFPEPLQRRLSHLDVCVLSGLQLFGLVMQARENSTIKEKIVSELFETRGVLLRAVDWKEFFTTAS